MNRNWNGWSWVLLFLLYLNPFNWRMRHQINRRKRQIHKRAKAA